MSSWHMLAANQQHARAGPPGFSGARILGTLVLWPSGLRKKSWALMVQLQDLTLGAQFEDLLVSALGLLQEP